MLRNINSEGLVNTLGQNIKAVWWVALVVFVLFGLCNKQPNAVLCRCGNQLLLLLKLFRGCYGKGSENPVMSPQPQLEACCHHDQRYCRAQASYHNRYQMTNLVMGQICHSKPFQSINLKSQFLVLQSISKLQCLALQQCLRILYVHMSTFYYTII